jgi:hypothetical protein
MSPRKPGQTVSFLGGESGHSSTASAALISVLGVLAGLVAVAFFLLLALILLKRYSKQVERPSLTALRYLSNHRHKTIPEAVFLVVFDPSERAVSDLDLSRSLIAHS